MRAQTPSFVVSVKLLLPEQIQNHLEKSFRIANSAYNEALSFGLHRFDAMKQNPSYQELLELRRELLAKNAKNRKTKSSRLKRKRLTTNWLKSAKITA